MENILTPEEKKYLRFISKYLLSYGEDVGTIKIEDFDSVNIDDLTNSGFAQFDENYYLEVPEQLEPIIIKVARYAEPKIPEVDEDMNSSSLDIVIDAKKQELTALYSYSYYTNEDSGVTYSSSEDGIDEVFEEMSESNIDWVEVPFTGSGDSGSIDTPTDIDGSMVSISPVIEDWCYNQLERNYGGWEINEGSQGKFIFDNKAETCQLDFSWNNEVYESDTIFEFPFGN